MRRALLTLVALLALSACTSDDDRTDIIDVDGVRCAVVRNGVGKIEFIDCDWETSPR